MTGASGQRSFGITGDLPAAIVREVAQAAQAAGYDRLWINDDPGGEALVALAVAAAATTTIGLAAGLLPLDRWPPQRITARSAELELPVERLTLGVGSGVGASGLARVRDGVEALRGLTRAKIVVGALGPKMCELAGAVADGVLLDWPTPAHAHASAALVGRSAASAGRARPPVAGYVFTALGAAALQRLQADGEHYLSVPAYASHFRRMSAAPADAWVAGDTAGQIQHGLGPYGPALDETVVRACVAEPTVNAHLHLLAAAAPARR
jgi:alkanesulfonate monooxygenase SsuD/methylene tetrahydromethanopterin reductase-like flavin-dependent oxidoreductase (luciferase family)